MRLNLFNSIATLLSLGALTVSTVASADDSNYDHNYNQSYAPVYMPSYACTNCCGTPCCEPPVCGWAYNPPAYCKCDDPHCCNPCNKYGVYFDFLWWKANVQGIALGDEEMIGFVSTGNKGGGNNDIINKSKIKKPQFKFDPGFRLGIADYSICDCWDAKLEWTHYHTTAHAHGNTIFDMNKNQPITVFLSYWERLSVLVPTEAKSRYALTTDLLDLEFGRKYYVSSCFIVRPNIGLRGARINQSYKVASQALTFSGSDQSTPFGIDYVSATKSKNDYLAIGPRVGLDVKIDLGCGLSIVGKGAGSIVYGRFNRHSKESINGDINFNGFGGLTGAVEEAAPTSIITTSTSKNNNPTTISYETQSGKECASRTFTDLSIGLRWERCFDWCNRIHPIGLEFTWEHHGFYNMSNFDYEQIPIFVAVIAPTSYKKTGDVYTQGMTFSATVGF